MAKIINSVQVKATLKSERAKVPRRRFSSRQRTSRFMGVGSSNRKNQWQARILVHGKVGHAPPPLACFAAVCSLAACPVLYPAAS